MNTKLSSIGFTLVHEKGKIEICLESIYGSDPTVFVQRERRINGHAFGELKDALKGYLRTSGTRKVKINLYPEELQFLRDYGPVFQKLNEISAEELRNLMLEKKNNLHRLL